ncbi:MAG: 50S ribosomal protein L4 [Thermodesulfobacteriota bacterium]
MQIDIVNTIGVKVSKVDLKDEVFDAPQKDHLFYEVTKMQLANRRAGTASTKNRSDVRGGGAKPFKQKGTGRARQGTSRSPINRGGGVVFGPKPRDYSYKVPKKVVKAALSSALSLKAREGKLKVVENLDLSEPKTKVAVEFLSKIGATNVLLVTAEANRNVELATRNIKGCKALRASGLNVYDILKYDHIVISSEALAGIEERLTK